GRPYFVMELVKGVPLTHYCDQNHLGLRDRLDLFMQVCHAVQHAHTKGIIHRDIKPSNILVVRIDDHPSPKVIDFGIAKATGQTLTDKTLHTQLQQVVGTPQYMSPEQAASSVDIDTRPDAFSLGVVLSELLTGLTPYTARDLHAASRALQELEPPRPSTRVMSALSAARKTRTPAPPTPAKPSDATIEGASPAPGQPARGDAHMAHIIARVRGTEPAVLYKALRGDPHWTTMRAMEKDRTRRYETASAMAADIQRHLANEPVSAGPPSAAYRLRKFTRRHRGTLIAAGGVFAALVLGLGLALYGLVQARLSRDAAEWARQREAALRRQADANLTKAEANQTKAEAINKFLLDMLGSADLRAAGREAKVSQALQRASKSVGESFNDQPEVE